MVAASFSFDMARKLRSLPESLRPDRCSSSSIENDSPALPQIVSGGDTTFHYQLRHVLACIEDNAQPLTGGDDAINNMRAIDAVYRAAGLRPRGLRG